MNKTKNIFLTPKKAHDLIKSAGGSFFSVKFIKGDGTIRDMVCRKGVKSHLKGGNLNYNPADYKLETVFDVQKNEYRNIPLNKIIEIKVKKDKIKNKKYIS